MGRHSSQRVRRKLLFTAAAAKAYVKLSELEAAYNGAPVSFEATLTTAAAAAGAVQLEKTAAATAAAAVSEQFSLQTMFRLM
jgi:hypothetical protein